MTKQEAAEIILRNDPFEICASCTGLGFKSGRRCEICPSTDVDSLSGAGKQLKPDYLRACAITGVEPPPVIWNRQFYLAHRHKVMMTKEAAIEAAKRIAKTDKRVMAIRNDYGDYSAWYHYTELEIYKIADAGANAGGVLSCFVYPDGSVVDCRDVSGPP